MLNVPFILGIICINALTLFQEVRILNFKPVSPLPGHDQYLIYINRLYNQSKKGGKDQESIQSSTTPDPGYHMGK